MDRNIPEMNFPELCSKTFLSWTRSSSRKNFVNAVLAHAKQKLPRSFFAKKSFGKLLVMIEGFS